MAMTTAMQSLLGSPVTHMSSRASLSQFVSFSSYPRPCFWRSSSNLMIRCISEEGGLKEQDDQKEDSSRVTPTPSPQLQNPTPPQKVSTKFSDVLAFSGPGPERINGRLAMIGFVSAIGMELANGQDVFSQISNGGIPWFLGTSIVLSVASLIPLFKGISVQSKSEGVMTSDAELWNGRFAMLGLVALAFTEYVKGSALV